MLALGFVAVYLAAAAPSGPAWVPQDGLRAAGFPAAWRSGTGAGIVVAVVDSGVDRIRSTLGGRVLDGRDLVDDDFDASDANGHGTSVAELAAGGESAGVVMGAAPEARVLPVRVLDTDGRAPLDRVAEGVRWAANNGATVVVVAFGEDRHDGTSLGGPINEAISEAFAAGAVVVVAAGNDGASLPPVKASTPAVVVGAADPDGSPRPYSNTGRTDMVYASDGGLLVTEAAPAAWPPRLRIFEGTSAAAAVVAGVAADLLSGGTDPRDVPAAIREAVRDGSSRWR